MKAREIQDFVKNRKIFLKKYKSSFMFKNKGITLIALVITKLVPTA